MPCECCGAGQVLVLRGPGPAVAARAVDHASASACGTKRVRPLSSTSLADGARLGRPALSGVGAGSATDPLSIFLRILINEQSAIHYGQKHAP